MGVFRLASSEPVIAAKEPFEVTLKPGKVYMWCACGLSSKQVSLYVHSNIPYLDDPDTGMSLYWGA